MKTYIKISVLLFAVFLLDGCTNKDFLDRKPKDALTAEAVFNNYGNIQSYAWQFYDVFPGYDRGQEDKSTNQLIRGSGVYSSNSDADGDLMDLSLNNGESDWWFNRITVPTSSYLYTAPYNNIRAINTMLKGLESATGLSESEINHWKSIGYFFRAYNHAYLLNKYGNIIYVDELVTEESELLYSARTPREEVAKQILDDLLWAEENIGDFDDGPKTVNQDVINAFISRFGIMEGTWWKYHGIANGENLLKASALASEKIMEKYSLHPNFDEVFNSVSLSGVSGIILYKEYSQDILTHTMATWARSSSGREDVTKKGADKFLMADGETRWTSPLFEGEKTPYEEFRNRDRRMLYTISVPFRVNSVQGNRFLWEFTADPADAEYFPIMEEISDDMHKTLPTVNWRKLLVKEEPNYYLASFHPYNVTGTGYRFVKLYNKINDISSADINDAPIFRLGEVLVNYAEAKFELGEFNQNIADKTINQLRKRGGVAPLVIGSEPEDPTRDNDVHPTLWEIRRERAVELMGEGFRFDDLRRWKKGGYLNKQKLGRWEQNADYDNKLPIRDGADEGYIALDPTPPQFPDFYYLYPIPSDEILLNPNLKQNSGW